MRAWQSAARGLLSVPKRASGKFTHRLPAFGRKRLFSVHSERNGRGSTLAAGRATRTWRFEGSARECAENKKEEFVSSSAPDFGFVCSQMMA